MLGRWGLALAATALVAVATGARGAPGDRLAKATVWPGARSWEEGPCALAHADRARTQSRDCMVCHDGSAGPAVSVDLGGASQPTGFASGIATRSRTSHPSALDYELAAAKSPGRYQPSAALPPDVPLVNGRVECTTCHDGRSTAPRRVVAGDRLCHACHRL